MMRAVFLWMVLALSALVPFASRADCQFLSGSTSTVSFTVDPVSLAANTPNGTVIGRSSEVTPPNPPSLICGPFLRGEQVTFGIVNARGSYLADKYTFETGTPGIGYRITHPTDYLTAYPFNQQNLWVSTFNVPSTLELVKTGAIQPGVLTAGKLADWRWDTLAPETFVLGAPVTITAPTCALVADPLNVTLPSVTTGAFTGIGSTSGTTPFQINLACPAGVSVTKITMHTAFPASYPGVVKPAGAGYAAGIGVRVLDGNMNPVVFETQTALTPNATTSIPYYAQYFQTAAGVTGGNVKATVTFDIFYQ